MTLLNRWFSGRMMKRFLLIVVFLLLAATIWFLGPFLGFGDAHPWQGIEARVIFLLLSVLLLVGLWCHVPVFILLAVLACAAIWVVGPFVMLGEKTPLVSVGYRVVLIALIAAVTLGYGIWYLLGALAKNPQLLDKFRREKTPASDHDSQLPEIRAVIKQGMQYVARIHRAIPWWKRFFIVRDRHDLPWYLVMGMPDAGKTAMIFSSGQDLPLPEQLNRKSKEPLPTRHCECIFSNQAVFLDTSGKYIKQDSETDAQWQLIVNELKKHRPVNSIHGVMLAFSTDNILGKSQSELLEISAVLRARLDALRHILGERFPVYVMITKLDQLCGFDAYFRHLTAEEREQIWGVTLPYAARQQTLQLQVKQELTRLEQRICATMNVRQQEEYDVADRKSMYALEQDFRLLAQGVTQVLENLFLASRYDDSHFYSTLRGVYFVSNCQPNSHILRNNNTVVQKWYHAVTRQRPHTEASLSEVTQERGELVSEVAYGRHYFLKQLLDEVIDKDIHLVTGDHKRNMSARLQNIAAHLLCMVLCVWLIKGMYESYQLNHGYLQHHSGNVQYLESKNNQYVNKPEEAQLALLLNQAQHLAEYRDLEVLNPELPWRYGLYTGWSVAKGADKLYQFFLQRYLLPQLEQQVSESLFQALDRDDTAQLYNVLKRYLMLYGEGEMDTTFLVDDLTRLWQESGRIDAYSDAEIFSAHLQKLFSLPQWRRYGQKVDMGSVQLARQILAGHSQSTRLWQRIKLRLQDDAPANISLEMLVGDQSTQIFESSDEYFNRHGVPGLYSYEGYQQLVKKKLMPMLLQFQHEENWVMGHSATITDPLVLRENVLVSYLREYQQHWQRFLSSIRLQAVGKGNHIPGKELSLDMALLRTLTADNSPLRSLLEQASRHTRLSVKEKPVLSEAVNINTSGRLLAQAKKIQQAFDSREQQLIRQWVDSQFATLHQFAGAESLSPKTTESTPASRSGALSQVLVVLSQQYARLVLYQQADAYGEVPPVSKDMALIQAQAQTWPDPVKNIVMPLLAGTEHKFIEHQVKQELQNIGQGIGELCRTTLQGKYPFTNSSNELSITDFERFFATDGVIDNWFKQHLADKVSTASSPWHFKGSKRRDGLAFFEQAAQIRTMLLNHGDGKRFGIDFSLAIDNLSKGINELVIDMDGQRIQYAHGPVVPAFVSWPGSHKGSQLNITAHRARGSALPDLQFYGPWAVLRWLDRREQQEFQTNGGQRLRYQLGKDTFALNVRGLNQGQRDIAQLLKAFRCPTSI